MEAPAMQRPTYTQDWPAYNRAQQGEGALVGILLRDLVAPIPTPRQGRGRPRLPVSDVLFAMIAKVYGGLSTRRSTSDIRDAAAKGLLDAAPHYNSTINGFNDPALTPILKKLIVQSALPLRYCERNFAIDSTGFGTCTYRRWFDEKYGKERSAQKWVKAHAMIGTMTHVVIGVEVTDGDVNDYTQFEPLVLDGAERFHVNEISADKAYLSHAHLDLVSQLGATAYIPFKEGTLPEGSDVWRKLYHMFHMEPERFGRRYHLRSNVESVFSMLKRKFGGAVRSKTFTAQTNEILCKIVAHNLSVLVHSSYEFDLDTTFWAGEADAHKVS